MAKPSQNHARSHVIFSDDQIKSALHRAATRYEQVSDKRVLFISSDRQSYMAQEAYFGEENFIHLAGFRTKVSAFIKANPGETPPKEIAECKKAPTFFSECLNGTVDLTDFVYKEDKRTSSAKLEVFPDLLNYKYVKLYKMGDHDLITEKNEFEYCVGNRTGIVGFDRRANMAPYPFLSRPVTVVPQSIENYCTRAATQNVVAILYKKDDTSKKYDTVLSAVKSGIEVASLPEDIQKKIDPSLVILK